MTDLPETNLTMLTLAKPEGELEVYFERRPMPEPTATKGAASSSRRGRRPRRRL